MARSRTARIPLFALLCISAIPLCAAAQAPGDARTLLLTMVDHENAASAHRGHYLYTSQERSDRTGGHLWVERVAETGWGKVRYLTAVDGQPLAGDALAKEKARIAGEAADPEGFRKAEAARADDEAHAKQMLALLPKAFLFDPPVSEGAYWRIPFRPNPDYSPASTEEKVLHGMNGTVLVDKAALRLHAIDGRMPQDVSVAFGIATIRAGSNFNTTRTHLEQQDWKTETLHTDIKGKALLLKTLAKQQDSKHGNFKRIADGMTVAEAVNLLEQ